MGRNTYRLGVKPSAWYLSQFDEEDIQIYPAVTILNRSTEAGASVEIGSDDLVFELCMPLTGSSVCPRHIEDARSVLGQIVEMDDQARAVPSKGEDDEELAAVRLGEGVVWLDYVSSTVNSEWASEFTRDEDGAWKYRGIRQRDGLVEPPASTAPR